MITAILLFKDGREEKRHIKEFMLEICIVRNKPSEYMVEEFMDLTPENIIDQGGFTQVEEIKVEKTWFLLYESVLTPNSEICYYRES